jgi:hypothetical protein
MHALTGIADRFVRPLHRPKRSTGHRADAFFGHPRHQGLNVASFRRRSPMMARCTGVARVLAVAVFVAATNVCLLLAQAPAPVVELRGASWFDGRAFARSSRWMQAGRFVSRPAVRADSVVDLTGKWMIPPFGDAHTHSPDGAFGFEGIRDMYLGVGVFYVQALTNSRTGRRDISARVNTPTSIDVAFADWAVTGTGGHPQILYELLGLYRRPSWENEGQRQTAARSRTRDGDVYMRLDSLPQLAPIIARMSRDTLPLLKVMLLDSEHWETRHRDSTQFGWFGMNPSLLPPLVDAAHRLGRRVWAHVETPYDMAIALSAGVDGFAHTPGYGAPTQPDSVAETLLIPDSTIRLAGARRVMMTPTLGLMLNAAGEDTAKLRRLNTIAVRNIAALRRAGVRLLAGSDTYSDAAIVRSDPAGTARLLRLSPLEYLRLWAVETPTAIFPNRRIGQLRAGFEASALALSCNPLRDTACLASVSRRMKQGVWLSLPSVAP